MNGQELDGHTMRLSRSSVTPEGHVVVGGTHDAVRETTCTQPQLDSPPPALDAPPEAVELPSPDTTQPKEATTKPEPEVEEEAASLVDETSAAMSLLDLDLAPPPVLVAPEDMPKAAEVPPATPRLDTEPEVPPEETFQGGQHQARGEKAKQEEPLREAVAEVEVEGSGVSSTVEESGSPEVTVVASGSEGERGEKKATYDTVTHTVHKHRMDTSRSAHYREQNQGEACADQEEEPVGTVPAADRMHAAMHGHYGHDVEYHFVAATAYDSATMAPKTPKNYGKCKDGWEPEWLKKFKARGHLHRSRDEEEAWIAQRMTSPGVAPCQERTLGGADRFSPSLERYASRNRSGSPASTADGEYGELTLAGGRENAVDCPP